MRSITLAVCQSMIEGARDAARRVVVKVGSNALAASEEVFARIAEQIAAQHKAGRSVVLVSSGAIALGWKRLGLDARPADMARLQASAAAGQSRLMRAYEHAFEPHGLVAAQVLLTHADLAARERYLNAREAIDALLELGAVPVINENDTVSVEEIRFGDNDELSAMLATLVGAELLVLLTSADGLLDAEGGRVSFVSDVESVRHLVRADKSAEGRGGFASKLEAAKRAMRGGVAVVVANIADPHVLERILGGDDVGTLFLESTARLQSRKHWIAYTLKPKGSIVVDDGAAKAISGGKSSLLPAGVLGVRGRFAQGDAVSIVGPDGKEIARGLTRYATEDVATLAGAKRGEIASRLGHDGSDVVVHRDDLVEI
ncbi:MAG: glutamate 5-kinase [Polyangiales bacterium]